MIKKDDIQELFSRSLENHTTPVRPEVWSGLQAKMAAAGLTTAAGATAAKGMSLLTKWIIGGAAAVTTTVVTTLVVMQQNEPIKEKAPAKELAAESNSTAASNDEVSEASPSQTGEKQQMPDKIGNGEGSSFSDNSPFKPHSIPFILDTHTDGIADQVDPAVKENPAVVQNQSVVGKETTPTTGTKTEEKEGSGKEPEEANGKEQKAEPLKFPDVFTPNSDGVNDTYLLLSRQDISPDGFSITIVDAQFKPVITSSDPNFEWDGMMQNGDPAPEGSYSCIVIGKYKDNSKLRERASFRLIRK